MAEEPSNKAQEAGLLRRRLGGAKGSGLLARRPQAEADQTPSQIEIAPARSEESTAIGAIDLYQARLLMGGLSTEIAQLGTQVSQLEAQQQMFATELSEACLLIDRLDAEVSRLRCLLGSHLTTLGTELADATDITNNGAVNFPS